MNKISDYGESVFDACKSLCKDDISFGQTKISASVMIFEGCEVRL